MAIERNFHGLTRFTVGETNERPPRFVIIRIEGQVIKGRSYLLSDDYYDTRDEAEREAERFRKLRAQ